MVLNITNLDDELTTPELLAQTIVGRAIPISNVEYTGSNLAAGIFSDDFDPDDVDTIVLRESFTEIIPETIEPETSSVERTIAGEATSVNVVNFANSTLGIPVFTAEEASFLPPGSVTPNGSATANTIFDGVVLSTGLVSDIPTVEDVREPPFEDSTAFGLAGDALLEAQITPDPTSDAAVLEFDFVPDLETLAFRFIFASDEYSEFDNRQFNDAFAFFLSGPRQDGSTFLNENIAQIPDTDLAVSVNGLFNSVDLITTDTARDDFIGDANQPPSALFSGIDIAQEIPDLTDRGAIVAILFENREDLGLTVGGFRSLLVEAQEGLIVDVAGLSDATLQTLLDNFFAFVNPAPGTLTDSNIDPTDPEVAGEEFRQNNELFFDGEPIFDFNPSQLTTIFEARAEDIIPGETYTARIVIADTFDDIVDSAVFIENQDQTRFLREEELLGDDLDIDLNQVVAVNDIVNTLTNTPIDIDVLANDVDPQRDPRLLEFNENSSEGGTVVRDDNNTPDNPDDDFLRYTPPSGFVGTDSFTYEIEDDTSLTGGPQSSAEATVFVNVFEDVPGTLETDDSIFFISGNDNVPTQSPFQLSMELQGRSAAFVNEIGVVRVDSQNRINGVSPEDPGYLREAIEESQVVFSALTQRVIVDVNSTRQLDFFSGDRLLFFLVQDESIDTVRERLDSGAADVPNVFFAIPEANDGDEQLQIDQDGDVFTLRWEDLPASDEESDNDFNDLIMTLQLTENPDLVGTGLQGEVELLDLRGLNDIEAQFLVQDDAAFGNTVGFYEVDNPEGTITTVDDTGTNFITLNPGDVGYAEAAIENTVVSFGRDGTDDVELEGLLAPYIIANATPEEFLEENPRNLRGRNPLAFFPYFEANPDGADHIRLLGDNTFGFEDLPDGISDFDFEDMVVEVQFS